MDSARFRPVVRSLRDLIGEEHADAVSAAHGALLGTPGAAAEAEAMLSRRVEFYPASMQRRQVELLARVGERVSPAIGRSAGGATTRPFAEATRTVRAPVGAFDAFRVGEDGRLYLATKSEHYHTPVGHRFPGFELVLTAQRLGLPNATHNNTRGHVTRRLEEELLRHANAAAPPGAARLEHVLNLETGSLACEAAIKVCLARFYQSQPDAPEPRYRGRVPVFFVIADDAGGPLANYHGTTVIAQALRGMWPDLLDALERHDILRVQPIRPDDIAGFRAALQRWDAGRHKVAGFFYEPVLMNYGGRVLARAFIRDAWRLCRERDIPTIADEIQTGVWGPRLFFFAEDGVVPSMVTLGKGFPGGQYPASRLLMSDEMDLLPQFGALVTNGQEELASLAYLVTMTWATENADLTAAVGERYEQRLRDLADRHRGVIAAVHGRRHLCGIQFGDVETAKRFASAVADGGLDISVQTYKTTCPPAALTKLPLIAGDALVDLVIERLERACAALAASSAVTT